MPPHSDLQNFARLGDARDTGEKEVIAERLLQDLGEVVPMNVSTADACKVELTSQPHASRTSFCRSIALRSEYGTGRRIPAEGTAGSSSGILAAVFQDR